MPERKHLMKLIFLAAADREQGSAGLISFSDIGWEIFH